MSVSAFRASRIRKTSVFLKTGIVVAALVAATAASAQFWPSHAFSPFAPYYLAVLIGAVYGGVALGGAVIAVSIGLVHLYFLGAADVGVVAPFVPVAMQPVYGSALFAVFSGLLVWLLQVTRSRDREATAAKENLVSVLESARLAYWSSDEKDSLHHRSKRYNRLFGYFAAVPEWNPTTFFEHVHPDDRQRVQDAYDRALASSSEYVAEYRVIWPDGSVHWLQSLGRGYVEGRHVRAYGVVMNIDDRKRSEAALRRHSFRQSLIADFGQSALAVGELHALLDAAVGLVNDGLGTTHARVLRRISNNYSFTLEASRGWPASAPVHVGELDDERTARKVASTGAPLIVADFMNGSLLEPSAMIRAGNARSMAEVPIVGTGGAWGVLGAYADTADAFEPETLSFLGSVANILATVIERKQAAQRLTYLSQFDTLTGLPNRSLFLDRVQQSIVHAHRNNEMVGLLFIDLDRFKIVNDTLGHAAGDELLRHVATRLGRCIRSSDSVGRLGGDEFALVLPQLGKGEDARLVAQKLADVLAQPFQLSGQTLYASACVGISMYPSDGADAEELLKNADSALYRAKSQGSGQCHFYVPKMNDCAVERLRTESELRVALRGKQFLLHYQPKVSLTTGEISGFEALLRWQHPTRGLVPPLDFISILEDTGLIVEVGEWVMREACRQLALWSAEGLPPRPIAVNLSARQFRQADLDCMVARILSEFGVRPGLLEFELTESMLMEDPMQAARLMESIGKSGVRLSVDDFGTGYSSLAYLKRFPLDALKIDRMFVRDVCIDEDDATIALAIINLAHSLKLKVVAEGVETQQQIDFLRLHGCDEMQGYFFAKPSEAAACTRMLREDRRLPVAVDVALDATADAEVLSESAVAAST
ncbi:hypothetical protein BH09PSE5_BH09PSE5_02080 [soil metagenome]